jgi:hypothetical protein
MKAVHLNVPGDLRVQRRSFAGKTTKHGEQLFFQLLLNAQQILLGPYSVPDFDALVVLPPRHLRLKFQIR